MNEILNKDIYFNWNNEKNNLLRKERNISFEIISSKIEQGYLLDIICNPNYENQQYFVLDIDSYVWLVPFVLNDSECFLKTAFPSRKFFKLYKQKGLI